MPTSESSRWTPDAWVGLHSGRSSDPLEVRFLAVGNVAASLNSSILVPCHGASFALDEPSTAISELYCFPSPPLAGLLELHRLQTWTEYEPHPGKAPGVPIRGSGPRPVKSWCMSDKRPALPVSMIPEGGPSPSLHGNISSCLLQDKHGSHLEIVYNY